MNIPLSIPQYSAIGFALILLGRAIHYLAVTRYLREHGVANTRPAWFADWKEWTAYRRTCLANHRSLVWWYVLLAIQVILFFWVAGWIANGVGGVTIYAPTRLPKVVSATEGYTTVFDVSESGYRQWSFAAFGLIFVAAGLAMPLLIRIGLFRKPSPWMAKWFPRIFVGFATLWTITSFLATYSDYHSAVQAMRSQQAHFVEGTVNQFKPMPYTGHGMESFVVQGVRFEYSDYIITAGFNNTASHGGPIREGLPVRIWYRGNEILRLDVATWPNTSIQRSAGQPNA